MLLDGLYDPDSNLSKLRGCQHVMRKVWDELVFDWEGFPEEASFEINTQAL